MVQQQRPRRRKLLLYSYIAVIYGAVLAGGLLTWQLPARHDLPLVVTLSALALVARQWGINIYGRGHFSVHIIVISAAALLLGPTVGICLGIAVGLVYWPWKSALIKYVFDGGQYALTALILALLPGIFALWQGLPAPLLLALEGFVVAAFSTVFNTGLVVGVMAIDEGTAPLAIWRERFSWQARHRVILGILAIGMAQAARQFGIEGALIFALPVFMMRLVMQQYLDHTRDSVEKLRAAHDELAEAHENLRGVHEELAQNHTALERAYGATRLAFSGMLRARDDETDGHSERVTALALALGRALGLGPEALAAVEIGAQLHDIGKVGVADAILFKPGKLTPEEWEEMRRHPVIGAELVAQIPFLDAALPVVRHHHERWDGTGYPDRLQGEEIPLPARIFAVADVYDALVSDRPYRRGMTPAEAITIIERDAGTHFDRAVVEVFLELIATGELIGLSTLPFPEPSNAGVITNRRRASDWAPAGRIAEAEHLRAVPARS
jgi:HD-GYP domain-containing protein (c-di-GMP phosphodiesterase class II)